MGRDVNGATLSVRREQTNGRPVLISGNSIFLREARGRKRAMKAKTVVVRDGGAVRRGTKEARAGGGG